MINEFLQNLATRLDIPGFPWKRVVLSFSLTQFTFESWLLYRQYQVHHDGKIPKALATEVAPETFSKSQKYAAAKLRYRFLTELTSTIKSVAILYYDLLPAAWYFSGYLVRTYSSARFSGEITQSIVFFLLQTVFEVVTAIPEKYYYHFVLEEKFGFNKMTTNLWVTDMVKETILSIVFMSPITAAAVTLIKKTGPSFFYYIWLLSVGLMLAGMTIFPAYITPLFNKLEPLPEGKLRSNLEELCKRVKFPLAELLVIDGSKRSAHSNAYFTGLPWKKQIVLYDTLVGSSDKKIDGLANFEVEGVLAHEIGHWSMNHILRMIGSMQIYLFLVFMSWSSFVNNGSFFQSFGFAPKEKPIMIGFLLFMSIYSPISFVVSLMRNLATQSMEYEADEYAVSLGHQDGLGRALIRLQIKNLAAMSADPIYAMFNLSHPPLADRLSAIKWVSGEKPVIPHAEQVFEGDKKDTVTDHVPEVRPDGTKPSAQASEGVDKENVILT